MEKKQNNKGAAMIFVTCIMAIILALCFALLLLSYSLVTTSNKAKDLEQCQVLADSFSEEIKAEIVDVVDGDPKPKSWKIPYLGGVVNPSVTDTNSETPKIIKMDNGIETNENASALLAYITQNIWTNAWPYCSDEGDAENCYQKFNMIYDGEEDAFGKYAESISVLLYYEWEEPNESDVKDPDVELRKDGSELKIAVTSKIGDQSYTITSIFNLSLSPGDIHRDESGILIDEIWTWSFDGRE